MDLTAAWRTTFQSWPATLPKSGLIVLATQETVPFCDFLLGDSFVVVERDKPDSQGARKLIIALAAISAVKLTIPEPLETLRPFTEGASAVPPVPDAGFGMPSGVAARASAAVRRTGEVGRRPF
ncbi:MAG: hypothetical protein ACK5Q5_24645 [Planctomycetaceae bacterium]